MGCSVESNTLTYSRLIFVLQGRNEMKIVVDDSREGWRNALKVLLEAYFNGHPAPVLDVSRLR